ncbi:2-hydroxyacid dehydrogenase [Paenibacillus solisilvae]|uniref:2-hydroxyacid dehydrogenase n=1 Tax=Paenibacillus solisilvae TaxID=2486751 RepID=A0ABW0W2R0_9BACL
MHRKKAVLITAQGRATFSPEQQARLEEAGTISYVEALHPLSHDQLITLLQDTDVAGLTPRSVPSIEREWLARLPRLKGIAVFATGVDYIDVQWLEDNRIQLSNLPEYSTVSVAEHTIGMLLTLSRRIHLSQDRVRGRVPAGTSVKGWELRGKTIGLIGLGRIGGYVAELAQAFGMRVLGYDPKADDAGDVVRVSIEELLASSDIVSLHYPAAWQGTFSFGESELKKMKSGAYLLNVSRSALVDDAAVIQVIAQGHLRGYALDDRFSLAEDAAAQRLIAEGRILQTGHTAWYSQEVIDRGYDTWVDHVIGLLTDNPQHVVTGGGGSHALESS